MVALPDFIKKFFDANAREIEKYKVVSAKINTYEAAMEKLTDEELRAKTEDLKLRVQAAYKKRREAAEPGWATLIDQKKREADREIFDTVLDQVLPEAFAMVREASKRTIRLRHYDVQMIGGMVLHDGRIAEMRTGEGKTLVATAPLYLNALMGKGSHLVTANDYLSKRDAVWNGPIYHLLGMSVGIIQGQSPETGDEGGSYIYDPDFIGEESRYDSARPVSRKEAYACDITYGTNNEYGFDYLRDNMAFSKDELVQRELHFAIVDEVDSILIDEARTPLIISGMVEQSTERYNIIDKITSKLKKGIDDPKKDKDNPEADKHKSHIHYVVDEKSKTATITDAGVTRVEKELDVENLSDNHEMMHYLQASLKAHGVFRKDIDYVVKDNGEGPEIIIVDENTGRLMFGRRYSDGLHQAIEAKEHVEVKNESQTLATITFQNYFRLYAKLGGMTGTAKTEEDEFRKIYALDVVQVPTNKPIQRKDGSDIIYKAEEHKLRGIVAEILRIYCKKQPLLVGTRSIEMSERVSARMTPQSLRTLVMTEVARMKLEGDKSFPADKRNQWTAGLNMSSEPWTMDMEENGKIVNKRMNPLTMGVLRPILKELGLSDDPLSPENKAEIARIFEINNDGLERLEDALQHGIGHNILNAKYHEQEAVIIAEAGRKGAITIATNMAGRGVDILLGGKHINQELPSVDGSEKSMREIAKFTETARDEDDDEESGSLAVSGDDRGYRRYGRPGVLDAVTTGALTDEEHKKAGQEVIKLGGLYILGTERHESRRIDNQLRGRAGRQGDPGESRFFVSLEDELWRLFGDRANHPLLKTWEVNLSMDTPFLSGMIQNAQKKVEGHYFESRKHVLNYDDVMNRQRELIYRERRRILEGVNLHDTILIYVEQNITSSVALHAPEGIPSSEWNLAELYAEMDEFFALTPAVVEEDLHGKTHSQLVEFLHSHCVNVYQAREEHFNELQGSETMRELERWMALRAVNSRWMEHLANMDYLREGIGLRGYEQKDPLLIYQKEAFEEFERMQQSIQDDIVKGIYHVQIQLPEENLQIDTSLPEGLPRFTDLPQMEQPRILSMNGMATPAPPSSGGGKKKDTEAPADWKGGRNDACWCGSGKKYKQCHGK